MANNLDKPRHPVDDVYDTLLKKGYTQKDAAKEAQRRTGVALVTKKPIKPKKLKFTSKGTTYGQQDTLKKSKQEFGLYT